MKWFGKEKSEQSNDQVIEGALNDPGFTEFLKNYDNAENLDLSDSNAKEIQNAMNATKKSDK